MRYKHGLRLLLGGFGSLSQKQIDARRKSTLAALLWLTNRPVTKAAAGLMFEVADRLRPRVAQRRVLLVSDATSASGRTSIRASATS